MLVVTVKPQLVQSIYIYTHTQVFYLLRTTKLFDSELALIPNEEIDKSVHVYVQLSE